MTDIIHSATIWPHIKALIPNMPAETERCVITIASGEIVMVEARFAALAPDGRVKVDEVLGEIETRTERFALIPYGETRPPSEREAFIAELIEFVRDIGRLHDLCFATGARIMQGDQPFGEAHRILNERGNQAARLLRKHEGKT